MLVEEIHTKKMYAIKVLKKDFIVENDEVERCVNMGRQKGRPGARRQKQELGQGDKGRAGPAAQSLDEAGGRRHGRGRTSCFGVCPRSPCCVPHAARGFVPTRDSLLFIFIVCGW